MVKRQLVCNVFHNVASDDFYIGTASAIYCATGFPFPQNRSQMGALLGISEDTMRVCDEPLPQILRTAQKNKLANTPK